MFKKASFLRTQLRSLIVVVVTSFAVAAIQTSSLSAQDARLAPRAEIVVQLKHSGVVTSVAFSPDERTALSGSFDKTVKLWNVATGREIRTFKGHSGAVTSVTFSPDGRTALSGGGDKTIKFWDLASGRTLRTFTGHSNDVTSVAFSPDGRTALSGSNDTTVKLWDIASGREIRTFTGHVNDVTSVAFSPDGRTALSGSRDTTVKLWDVSSGREIRTFTPHSDGIFSVAFSLDGQTVLSISNTTIKLSDITTGLEIKTCTANLGYLSSLAFSLSGSFDRTLKFCDFVSGREIRTFTKDFLLTNSIAFSLDGRIALLGSKDNAVKVWDIKSGREIRTFTGRSRSELSEVALSRDGRTLLAGGDDGIKLWDVASGRQLRAFTRNAVASVAFSPDGRTALSTDLNANGPPTLWDVASGRETRTFKGSAGVGAVVFSPDGRTGLAGSQGGTLKLWDATSGRELMTFKGRSGPVTAVAFSPGGQTVLSRNLDGTLKLWDIARGREIRTFKIGSGNSVAFSPDGRTVLSGNWDGTLKLWDIARGREIRTFKRDPGLLRSVSFSPDGRAALSGGDAGFIKLWDVTSGRALRTFTGHSGVVQSVTFSPDGRTVLSGSTDGTIRLWDVASETEQAKMVSFRDGSWLTITPEGFFDASSAQAAQNLSVVRGLEISSVDQVYDALYRPDLVREKLAGDPDGKVQAAAAQLDLDKVMASGAAPKVAITSPASGSSSATDEVVVEASIVDQSGGIGKVEWRINGVTLGLESRGLDRLDAPSAGGSASGKTETVKRTLALEPGDNRIEVLAYNANELIASEAAQVTIKWDGAKTATPPKLYVLSVGVNDYYDSRLRLTYAVPDAKALAEGFRKAGNGLYASVEVRAVLDSDVTLANLDKVFTEISHEVKPRDVFVFFLAGHGKTKNGRYYFLPHDFRYEDDNSIEKAGMGQDKFQAWFASIPARKSLLLYDTCESGSLTGANARGSDVDERLGALNRMARATGRTFLTATTDDAPALEGYRGHGVFTYALLDALDHADINSNSLIEISELADYIDQKVPDYSYEAFKLRQIPQRSIVGNNFALTNKTEVLAAKSTSPKVETTIPAKPTHVVVTAVDVRASPNETASVAIHLTPGTQVHLLETTSGWVLIARDGQKLGYVRGNAVAGLQ